MALIPNKFPMNIAFEYSEKMNDYIEKMHNATLKKWKTNLKRQYKRAANVTDSASDTISQILNQLENEFEIDEKLAGQLANNMITKTRKFGINQVDDQIEAIAGVRPVLRYPAMADQIKLATRENVRLIKTIPDKYFSEVERVVNEGVLSGKSTDKIVESIESASNKSTNNARLIARDQVGKVLATTTKARQIQAGVGHYIWRSIGDNRVRDSHEDFDGNRYSWKEGSPEGHPGEPIQCRCIAEPDEDEVMNNFSQENII